MERRWGWGEEGNIHNEAGGEEEGRKEGRGNNEER